MNSVSPAAMSQTSCQLQSGPTARVTIRRSAALFATRCSTAPIPKLRPSVTAKPMNASASSAYQVSTTGRPHGHGHLTPRAMLVLRPVHDLRADDVQVHEPEHEIEPAESDQREQRVARADLLAHA